LCDRAQLKKQPLADAVFPDETTFEEKTKKSKEIKCTKVDK